MLKFQVSGRVRHHESFAISNCEPADDAASGYTSMHDADGLWQFSLENTEIAHMSFVRLLVSSKWNSFLLPVEGLWSTDGGEAVSVGELGEDADVTWVLEFRA